MGDEMDRNGFIKLTITTLHSGTFTVTVERTISVLALKLRIRHASQIMSIHQRLLFRGRVLKDDQHISDYQIEDGHTLYLVKTPTFPPLSEEEIMARQIYRVDVGNLGYLVQYDQNSNLGPSLRVIPNYLAFHFAYMSHLGSQLPNNVFIALISVDQESSENMIPIPSHLVEIAERIRQMLRGEVDECFRNLVTFIEDNRNVVDPSARRWQQGGVVVESGRLLEELGRLHLAFGRAILRTLSA